MKATTTIAIALLTAGLGTGCKETKTELETNTLESTAAHRDTLPVNETDGIQPGVSAGDPERPSSTNGVQPVEDPNGNGADKNQGSSTTYFSGDGSEGRTSSTAVNKAKAVQVTNRSNARTSTKTGYSAPDGTAAENYDGDMYTKHDTTRMPSGQTPIK